MNGTVETEVKIRIADDRTVLPRLNELGFLVAKERVFEVNVLYDTPDAELRNAGQILRLRNTGEHSVVTFKGPSEPGPHKTREEVETSVGSFVMAERILAKLGYGPSFRYEKYRTEFQRAGVEDATVTVDETPIGWFLELEGPPEWIDETARQLGFGETDYVLESYGRLYLAECERQGVEPTNMVFAS